MNECHRTKSLLKCVMIVFKTKVLKFVAFLMGGEDWPIVNRPAKNTLVLQVVLI